MVQLRETLNRGKFSPPFFEMSRDANEGLALRLRELPNEL